jgi:ABC-type bacteriocin/lantibiotic exporter with double-glycine peptidase domain
MWTSQRFIFLILLILLPGIGVLAMRDSMHFAARGECGPRSLYALCCRLKVPTTLAHIRRLSGGEAYSTSFAEMEYPAHALGLSARGYEMTMNELRRQKPLGILHIGGDHFVALLAYTEGGVEIADPLATGSIQQSLWSYSRLSNVWNGRILVINKTNQ